MSDNDQIEQAGEESYTAPVLTKHEALHALTGLSQPVLR